MKFTKMHGLSNDFIIVDTRYKGELPPRETIAALTHRKTGIGCDQFIPVSAPKDDRADCFMRILNAPDASEAEACGNATRCVASMLMREKDTDRVIIQTVAGLLECRARNADKTLIEVDMGVPRLEWSEFPLSEACDTLWLPIDLGDFVAAGPSPTALTLSPGSESEAPLPSPTGRGRGPAKPEGRRREGEGSPAAVNIGNPHCVFFVDDAQTFPVREIGPQIEHHPLFPQKTNVEFATVIDRAHIRMRVWERDTGETEACGSAACGTMAAAVRRGLVDRECEVMLNGGPLQFHWREEDGHLLMTGPVEYVFSGETS